jgi:hypothetical protein
MLSPKIVTLSTATTGIVVVQTAAVHEQHDERADGAEHGDDAITDEGHEQISPGRTTTTKPGGVELSITEEELLVMASPTALLLLVEFSLELGLKGCKYIICVCVPTPPSLSSMAVNAHSPHSTPPPTTPPPPMFQFQNK